MFCVTGCEYCTDIDENMTTGLDVKEMIKSNGYTIGEFASRLGLTHNTVTTRLKEWKLNKVTISEAHKWSKLLKTDIGTLFNLKV